MRIETERLLLRTLRRADGEPLARLWSDPLVTRYMGGPRDAATIRQMMEEEAGTPSTMDDLWPVVEKATGDVIGHCGLLRKQVDGRDEVELVYVLAASAWGHGYATEIAVGLRDYAFTQVRLGRLVALVDPDNGASARVAERVGMHLEKETLRPGGKTMAVYAIEAPLGTAGGAEHNEMR